MSMYRNVFATVAAMSLATFVFAADETTTTTTTNNETTPAATTTTADATTTTTTTTTQEKVNVNTATAKELMKVKGLNAAKAKAIITYRKKHGDFTSVDQIKEVKALKKTKNLQEIQDQLTTG